MTGSVSPFSSAPGRCTEGGDAEAMGIQQHWFALYTKPHKEHWVRDILSARKVEVYLPEIAVKTRRRDRRNKRPFFPHYLFARLDPQDGLFANLRWTPGL